MAKEQSGGRRTRRVNAWAKAAGEYYRAHKKDPEIKEFSDVLKSPKFKAYYHSKYGKKNSRHSFRTTRKASKGRFSRNRRFNKFEEEEDMEEEEETVYKGKKGKARKEVDDWSWGFDKKRKNKNNVSKRTNCSMVAERVVRRIPKKEEHVVNNNKNKKKKKRDENKNNKRTKKNKNKLNYDRFFRVKRPKVQTIFFVLGCLVDNKKYSFK